MNAHEIWSAAQLAPGEGIEDGVARIEALMQVQDAAAQAREKVLRNHFAELAKPDRRGSYQWFRDYAARALAQPTDDTALQDLILKERTRAIESWTALHMKAALASERERCVDALMCAESDANLSLQECIDAIRALGD